MKVVIQVEDINALEEALKSDCDKIRFGSEFCEWKIPSLELLERAYALVKDQGKTFVYVTPRVSNEALDKIREQLAFLDEKEELCVVVNDLGVLSLFDSFQNVGPCLGRQLVYMPARSPWKQITRIEKNSSTRRYVEKIFYQTSLNYSLTSRFFQKIGIKNIDVDWLPLCFPYFDSLIERGFNLSVHLFLVPITLTRKCHTARFLGEENPEACSKPCYSKTFLLKQKDLGVEFYLSGNVVFRLEEPSGRNFKRLCKKEGVELVASMSPIKKLDSCKRINEVIGSLKPKAFRFWPAS